jgi:hypothetical protein
VPSLLQRARYFWNRASSSSRIKTFLVQRAAEPLHLNFVSVFVLLFGSFRAKVYFDLVIRPQNAFPILYAADLAKWRGYSSITICEFGVASGTGLLNMCCIAAKVTAITGVEIRIVGFDTGTGMPAPVDYRDLPEFFQAGDYPMDVARLRASLPANAELHVGDLKETVPDFLSNLASSSPVGYVAVDVDYYSSTVDVLRVFEGNSELYLPTVCTYLDDIGFDNASEWTGELLAVKEFNKRSQLRKIVPFTLLRSKRLLQRAQWIDRMYVCHIHDHAIRTPGFLKGLEKRVIPNELLTTPSHGQRSKDLMGSDEVV